MDISDLERLSHVTEGATAVKLQEDPARDWVQLMTGRGGRSPSFDWAGVPLAIELREQEGLTWVEAGRRPKFSPGTRRPRRAELRGHIALHKTPALYFPEPEAGTDTTGGPQT